MIREHWKTSIWNGVIHKYEVSSNVRWSELKHDSVGRKAAYRQIESYLANVLCQTVGGSYEGEVSSNFKTLAQNDYCGPRYIGGKWAHIWVVALDDNVSSTCVGHIILHDPRTGAGLVHMPSTPWARAKTFSLVDGLSLIVPGWLGWSIPIVSSEYQHLLACISV